MKVKEEQDIQEYSVSHDELRDISSVVKKTVSTKTRTQQSSNNDYSMIHRLPLKTNQ